MAGTRDPRMGGRHPRSRVSHDRRGRLRKAAVSTGPYRWVRHPSYSGLFLIVTGCGLAAGNWLALAVCAVLPLPALLWRIHVEEAELTRVLDDRYRAYQAQTKRLIPGVW